MNKEIKSIQEQLPAELLSRADRTGSEYGWRPDDVSSVVTAARDAGLANLGGEVQYRLPGATCELYWLSYETQPRVDGEAWLAYVERSAQETLEKIHALGAVDEIRRQGIEKFSALRKKAVDENIDLDPFLYFVFYFVDQAELYRLKAK